MSGTTRRDALITIAGLSGSISSNAQSEPGYFNSSERECVTALVDAIIPRTETASASDAGVVQYMERRLNANPALGQRFRSGLALMEKAAAQQFGAGFAKLSSQQQVELLTPPSQDARAPLGPFFKLAKDLTIDGYYTSKEGLTRELGWHGNTFLTTFQGCTHPEHQS